VSLSDKVVSISDIAFIFIEFLCQQRDVIVVQIASEHESQKALINISANTGD
jgi:hypothetical protein